MVVCKWHQYTSLKGTPKPTVMRPEYMDFKDMASEINAGILALYKAYDHDIVLELGIDLLTRPGQLNL